MASNSPLNPAVPDWSAIDETLLGPGCPFETAEGEVFGRRLTVFKNRPRSLRAILERSRAHGDREYLVFGQRRFSYIEHARRVASVARFLSDRYGIQRGDRVAILAANCPEWIVAFWATTSLGGTVVAMNGWWAADEILYAIGNSRPKLLVADRKRLDRVRGQDLGVNVVEIEEHFEELCAPPMETLPGVAIDEDDPAVILYTSGTTGRPKGAISTHRNIIALLGLQEFHGARLMKLAEQHGIPLPRTQHVRLNAAPLFHVSGLYSAAVAQLSAGMKSVWLEGRFDAKAVLELIHREQVNGWAPLGPMAIRVASHPDRAAYNLHSVTTIGCGGAPVPSTTQKLLLEAFPNARMGLGIGYGLTECTGLATMISGAELIRYPDSVGKPLPTVKLEIRDEQGSVLPDGEEGDIFVQSPLVMKEYFGNPEATAAAIGFDGWLRTGDVGRIEEGRLYIASRRRDLILRAAENVYPVEIENRLSAHPAVHEAAVIGVRHSELGQEVKAVVVPKSGHSLSTEELTGFVREALAHYKVPSLWEIRQDPLPRNASGKVMKWLLEGNTETENPLSQGD